MFKSTKGPSGPFCFAINIIMKSLKHYIRLVETINQPPDHWVASIFVNYEFPNNSSIPQRTEQIETVIDNIFKKYNFYNSGGGGGGGARDVSYGFEGQDLAQVLAVAKKAVADVEQLIRQVKATNAKLGIVGLEISVSGTIWDSDYEHNLDFEEAEDLVRQTQQLGKNK